MTRILCYGDSNTYGFDPRDPLGGRYDRCWCDLLPERFQVSNMGMNGRGLPDSVCEYMTLKYAIDRNPPPDLMIILLGTNDVLMGQEQEIPRRLQNLLEYFPQRFPDLKVLLLSPPGLNLPDRALCRKMQTLPRIYSRIAAELGVMFCDIQPWNLSLAFDGVHLSEEGHRQLAERLLPILDAL